jgi:cbb3-type cytochrome oxidase maturation protein
MSVIFVLMGFGVLVAGSFLIAFLWAVRTGQFEDKHTPAMRILFDDEQGKDVKDSHTKKDEKGPKAKGSVLRSA